MLLGKQIEHYLISMGANLKVDNELVGPDLVIKTNWKGKRVYEHHTDLDAAVGPYIESKIEEVLIKHGLLADNNEIE